ncbi:MAG: glycosyltransferase family 39 protein [Candidatus Roizmanbacteria bacterium]|nr:glycosyltransferase family 39 protein [Candidatus Roizmanbacteria bacterium]
MLSFILLLALAFRLYGMNWDDGWHLHPDERMLIMVAERIEFAVNPRANFLNPYNNTPLPAQAAELLEPLNPDFFNYGSLPIYILRGTSDVVSFFSRMPGPNYANMLGIGRTLSVFFDCITVLLIYKISRILFKNKSVSLLASFLYALAFFPIQNAHFFIVDPLLTMFITSTLYMLIRYVQKPAKRRIVLVSLFAAGAITTKFTGILLLPIIGLGILLTLFVSYSSNEVRSSLRQPADRTIKNNMVRFLSHGFIFALFYLLFAFLFMPYGFLNYEQFIEEISLQLTMNSDPFIFPYTLQYVGTPSYWYYLKNIFLWGLGPVISLLATIGLYMSVKQIYYQFPKIIKGIRNHKLGIRFYLFLIFTSFYLLHFLVIGRSAVKFMRYMLPLYPYITILAGYGAYKILNTQYSILNISLRKLFIFIILSLSIAWTLMFMSIYSRPTTRIAASEWMYENIPAGSTIAVEHWDDLLPLPLPNSDWPLLHSTYQFETLELYNPDTPEKWERINEQLRRADYIVIASNRLYAPLQKLTDCDHLPPHRCYPRTANYYQTLFNDEGSFYKVAEFTSYPQIGLGKWRLEINDETADESFTVYDHPKVILFSKK